MFVEVCVDGFSQRVDGRVAGSCGPNPIRSGGNRNQAAVFTVELTSGAARAGLAGVPRQAPN
ncbi:hypothetical protein GCM10023166_14550 [Paeniglutamicibacter cryotolerans]